MLAKLKYILLLPVIGLIFLVLSWGLADAFSYQALKYEREWLATGIVAQPQDWDAAIKWSGYAIAFNPYNPNYPEMLGRLHFWRFFVLNNPVQSYEEGQTIVNQGLIPLKKSIEMRPTWPLAWASVLQLKSIGRQVDYEFERAWDRSVELGDWEPAVQSILLEAGLSHWPVFNDSLRQKTVSMFVAMTSKSFSESRAINVVNRLGAWPLVCNVLVDPILISDLMRNRCNELLTR